MRLKDIVVGLTFLLFSLALSFAIILLIVAFVRYVL